MAAGKISKFAHPVVTGAWTASSASAFGNNLTERIGFPSTGKWLVYGQCPICSTTGLLRISTSNGVIIRSNMYFNIESYATFLFIADVTASDDGLIAQAASSTNITFSYIERGYIQAIKLD